MWAVNVVGIVCCGVGVLVAFPLVLCTVACAYAQIFGLTGVEGEPPIGQQATTRIQM